MFGRRWRGTEAHGVLSVDGTTMTAPVKQGQTILQAAIGARIKFPNMCNVGECGTCRCRLIKGHVKLKRDITHRVPIQDLEKGYVLACQALAENDVLVEVPSLSPGAAGVSTALGKINQILPLTSDIVDVRVVLSSPIHYVAGQYARVSVPAEPSLSGVFRNFSFADAPQTEKEREARFFIRHVPGGVFTDWLFSADRTGTAIELAAAFGGFCHVATERPMLFVAGGSGLAPIKAVLEDCANARSRQPVVLLFAARNQQELYALTQISELASCWSAAFSFHAILSDEASSSGWYGERGLVTDHLDRLVPNLADCDLYMCGPPPMINAVIDFVGNRIPCTRQHFDRFFDQRSLSDLHEGTGMSNQQ